MAGAPTFRPAWPTSHSHTPCKQAKLGTISKFIADVIDIIIESLGGARCLEDSIVVPPPCRRLTCHCTEMLAVIRNGKCSSRRPASKAVIRDCHAWIVHRLDTAACVQRAKRPHLLLHQRQGGTRLERLRPHHRLSSRGHIISGVRPPLSPIAYMYSRTWLGT